MVITPRTRRRASGPRWGRTALWSLAAVVSAGGFTCAQETQNTEQEAPLARVGNDDPRGIDNQPDWDALADELREEVGRRFPATMPTDIDVACDEMLDAAKVFYESTEPETLQKAERAAEMAATREADRAACVAETSIEAAVCVRIRLGDRDSEFPWLLDQCSRAYPRESTTTPQLAGSGGQRAEAIELAFVGDVIFGRYRDDGFDPIIEKGVDPFADIAPLLASDVLVGNLETPVGEEVAATSPIGSKYRFAASRDDVKVLKAAGFDVMSLANNHFFDLRDQGQRDSPRILREEGITPIGASVEDGPVFRVDQHQWQGWTIGFIGVTTRRNAPQREGTPVLPFLKLREMVDTLGPVLEKSREENDLLVISVHWGDEYAEEPNVYQRKTAQALIDAGADLVIGHHPHVLQGIESHGQGVIAYSLGNFLFENTNAIPRLTGVLKVRYTGGGGGARPCMDYTHFEPAYIKRTPIKHPVPATEGMGKRVRDRVVSQGKGLGAEWVQIEGRETLDLRIPACSQ